MRIAILTHNPFIQKLFSEYAYMNKGKRVISQYSDANEYITKIDTDTLHDYVIVTDYKDIQKLHNAFIYEQYNSKIIYYGAEPAKEDQDYFKTVRGQLDVIVPTSKLASLLMNVLLREYVMSGISTSVYENKPKKEIKEIDTNKYILVLDDLYGNIYDDKGYDESAYYVIDTLIRKNKETQIIIVGDLVAHEGLAKLLYLQGYQGENVRFAGPELYEDIDVMMSWIDNNSDCIVLAVNPYINELLYRFMENGSYIFAPDIPDFSYLGRETLVPVQYYDDQTKKYEWNIEELNKVLTGDVYDTRIHQIQVESISKHFIPKNKFADLWDKVFDGFDELVLTVALSKELVAVESREVLFDD